MHRIDGPGATADNKFTDGDPVGGVQATVVTDDFMNDVQEELMSILVSAGVVPVKGTQDQVLKSITALLRTQKFTAYTTGGSSGAFTLTPTSPIVAYATNQRFQVTFNSAGGATPTLNVSGLGSKNLKQYSPTGTKVAAVITAGFTSDIVYDGTDLVVLDPLGIDAMPVTGGPYYPSFNGMRIAAEAGGYGTIGGYQGWGSNGSGTYQFINSKGGGSTGGFLFTHSDASGNLTNAMRYTPDGRLAVAVELVVPAIVGNTNAPTQTTGYTGTYLANCAFVANAIAAIPKNTATFTANSYSKNADTGEILQYKEVLIGDIPAGGATIDVTWPFAFPNAFHSVVSVSLKSADATVRHITTAYTSMGTVNGCRLQVDEANQSVQPASLTAVITARGR